MKKIYKILSVVLCFAMTACSLTLLAFAEDETTQEPEIILGDMNKNGKVETTDACLLLRLSANLSEITEEHLLYGDMNSDGIISVEDAVLALKKAIDIQNSGVVIPDKNGDNFLTDDPNNEFIKLIANTYNLDPASLVAIYSVPDSGTNYVLRFKKSLIGNKYEKSVDNRCKFICWG